MKNKNKFLQTEKGLKSGIWWVRLQFYRNEDWACWVRRSSGWHKWLQISIKLYWWHSSAALFIPVMRAIKVDEMIRAEGNRGISCYAFQLLFMCYLCFIVQSQQRINQKRGTPSISVLCVVCQIEKGTNLFLSSSSS